jgi:hypothetical protein
VASKADLDTTLKIEPFGIGLSTFQVTLQPQPGAQLGEVLASGCGRTTTTRLAR